MMQWEGVEDMTFSAAIEDLRNRPITDFVQLEKSQGAGMYCCPICGSGKGPNRSGALKLNQTRTRATCFSGERKCFGEHGEDTPGALAKIWNCNLREVLKRTGYQIDDNGSAPPQRKPITESPKPKADHHQEYLAWNRALKENEAALATVHAWGITDEAIDKFKVGYAEAWNHPKTPQYKSQRIIFPRSRSTYSARVYDRSFTGNGKYPVVGSGNTLFNDAVLDDVESKIPIVVVEGEIDAIQIWQTGHTEVIALGSTGNYNEFTRQAKAKNPTAVYILALDNDKSGKKTQAEIADIFDKTNIAYISADVNSLYDGEKDAGDAAPKDIDGFVNRLVSLYDEAYEIRENRDQQQDEEAYNQSGAGMVDSFLQEIQGFKFQPISTGIGAIDRVLGGGLIRQELILIGAAPGMGKTALVSQICEEIAKRGIDDILYINLEMSREVMLARSIARLINAGGTKITTNDILRGYSWDQGTKEVVNMAAQEYKDTAARHMLYNPGDPDTDLDAILKKIEAEKRRIGHAPIVVLDYLQLVTGKPDEDVIAVIKRTLQELKRYANDNNTVVIAISALNRDSMKTGQSGLNSGRDSSNIEYTADCHLGIEYESVGATVRVEGNIVKISKGKTLEELGAIKRAYNDSLYRNAGIPPEKWTDDDDIAIRDEYNTCCTRYIVRVNKNRFGDSDKVARLVFDGASARFLELDTRHTAPG